MEKNEIEKVIELFCTKENSVKSCDELLRDFGLCNVYVAREFRLEAQSMSQKRKYHIQDKLRVLLYAMVCGNVSESCRNFGISRNTFYRWKREYYGLRNKLELVMNKSWAANVPSQHKVG